jgi:hypothetical protein
LGVISLAALHNVHPSQITALKKQLLEGAGTLFEAPASRVDKSNEPTSAELDEQIGRLKADLDGQEQFVSPQELRLGLVPPGLRGGLEEPRDAEPQFRADRPRAGSNLSPGSGGLERPPRPRATAGPRSDPLGEDRLAPR